MSDLNEHDKQPAAAPAPMQDVDARALASQRRRRFIKLGASAVPVSLTLSSRPVMAWHCNTASMWGSVQGVSTTNSAYVRSRKYETTYFTNETYTIANWASTNSTRAGLTLPWIALGCVTDSTKSSKTNYYQKYTVGTLCGGGTAGLASTVKIWDVVKTGSSYTEFQRHIIVARLNAKLIPALQSCVLDTYKNDQLVAMSNRTYKGPDGVVWSDAKVVKYLKQNYIACATEAACGPDAA